MSRIAFDKLAEKICQMTAISAGVSEDVRSFTDGVTTLSVVASDSAVVVSNDTVQLAYISNKYAAYGKIKGAMRGNDDDALSAFVEGDDLALSDGNIDTAKSMAKLSINLKIDARAAQVVAEYPESEQQSWTLQKIEAEAYVSTGDRSKAKFLEKIATPEAGSLTNAQLKAFAQKVIANAENMEAVVAMNTKMRRKLFKEIEKAESVEQIREIIAEIDG